jgi:hypothetical protein
MPYTSHEFLHKHIRRHMLGMLLYYLGWLYDSVRGVACSFLLHASSRSCATPASKLLFDMYVTTDTLIVDCLKKR